MQSLACVRRREGRGGPSSRSAWCAGRVVRFRLHPGSSTVAKEPQKHLSCGSRPDVALLFLIAQTVRTSSRESYARGNSSRRRSDADSRFGSLATTSIYCRSDGVYSNRLVDETLKLSFPSAGRTTGSGKPVPDPVTHCHGKSSNSLGLRLSVLSQHARHMMRFH